MQALLKRRRRGQGLAEVAVVCSIMSSMAGGGAGAAWQALGTAQRTVAINQMKQIYLAIQMAADDADGRLPAAEMYPNIARDPGAVQNSPRSIVRLVGGGLPANLWVAPRAPEVFQKAGLTYIWNTALNGQLLDQVPDPANTWMLMDMNAAAAMLPELGVAPQGGGYLVLYADGHAKYQPGAPPVAADAEALRQEMTRIAEGGGPAAAAPGPGGGTGAPEPPTAVAPEDPDAEERAKEEEARDNNPDEDDAIEE